MPENIHIYQERLASFRNQIQKFKIDGFIIPRTDEFQGEFLAPYAERLAWLTGFTGSAGACIVLKDKAVVMSDGRYTIQLAQQVDQNLYEIADSTAVSIGQWLRDNSGNGLMIGYDPWLHTPAHIEKINGHVSSRNIHLLPLSENPIDHIWTDQPSKPVENVILFPDEIAGHASREKRQNISTDMKRNGIKACLLTMSDSICWLLNVRGADIHFSPLMLSYAILYDDGTLDWCVDAQKIPNNVRAALGDEVRIKPIGHASETVSSISGIIALDTKTAPVAFENVIVRSGKEYRAIEDPCAFPKSIKTKSEQDAIRDAHIKDGAAIVKFLKWIDDNANKIEMDEISAEKKLEDLRLECPEYLGASFPTIAGFAENGAIVHYRANESTNKAIKGNGLLLVDSGGQYKWGTTDITRTVPIGNPTQEMKENYTRVLKGHIAVANAKFKQGTLGKDIDASARKPLQDAGLDYAHGTGHGVGCYLCVHEAAANISPRGEQELKAGMLLSNEPGYYKAGEYGIRLENLVFVQKADDRLRFETITLAPFCGRLIVSELLSDDEKGWLDRYNQDTINTLSNHLNDDEICWLKSYIKST